MFHFELDRTIAGEYDERLRYALKKMKDVEVYLYRVDFKLEEFKN